MKGPALSNSRPVSSQFKVLTRRWHQLPVAQLTTRVRTNSLKILPTKYKIRLPANCAQVNCLISFKYELDRPSSLLASAQITWIRLGCPATSERVLYWDPIKHVKHVTARVESVLGQFAADSHRHAPPCPASCWNYQRPKISRTCLQEFLLSDCLEQQNNALDWQSGRKINL